MAINHGFLIQGHPHEIRSPPHLDLSEGTPLANGGQHRFIVEAPKERLFRKRHGETRKMPDLTMKNGEKCRISMGIYS